MSNATHFEHTDETTPICGGDAKTPTTADRARVTCRRCLASLAKRDREFQRKARRGLGAPRTWDGSIIGKAWWHVQAAADCARALDAT